MDTQFFDHYFAAWNRHDPLGVARHVADNGVIEDVTTGHVMRGPAEVAEFVSSVTASASDLHFEMCSLLTTGDSYLCEWVMAGTNDGPLEDTPATGRRFSVRGVSVGRLDRDGRIVENRDYWNRATVLTQLGLLAGETPEIDQQPLVVLPLGERPGW